jgi:ABC-type antimicrobial peptide transport system permease subunit
VINETMARQFWPGVDPIGKRVRFAGEESWNEVIGVVADVRMNPGFDPPYSRIQIYRSLQQTPSIHYTFILQSSLPSETLKASTRKIIGSIDPDLISQEANGVEARLRQILSGNDLMIFSLGGFAGVGMLIALIGVYAVISQFTQQRRREIGIRIALGASYSRVVRSILLQGTRFLVAGVGFGLCGAYGISIVFRHTMPELQQPGVELGILLTGTLGFAVLLACYFPARQAGRIDPVIALRSE